MTLLLSVLPSLYQSDLDRARRMLDGDEAEFERFFEESFDGLFRFALSRLDGDEALAQELVQATLCKAFERLETFRGQATLFTWLCSICRSEISHHFRRAGRAPLAAMEAPDEAQAVRRALEELAAAEDDAEDEALDRELESLVHLALDTLPERYRHILAFKYFDEHPVKEIAARLELSPKAAESLLTRARDAFRRAFTSLHRGLASAPAATRRASELRLLTPRNAP